MEVPVEAHLVRKALLLASASLTTCVTPSTAREQPLPSSLNKVGPTVVLMSDRKSLCLISVEYCEII